jgi:hypothetical protein
MTEQLHPMVPPNILLNNWESDWFAERQNVDVLLIQAYQAGADAELDECCKWVSEESPIAATELRAARRPKPPSLKEQALESVRPAGTEGAYVTFGPEELALIRRALEALPDD